MNLIVRLKQAFPLSEYEIRHLIQTAPARYKLHLIEKRNGRGQRLIAQPTAEVKLLQKWVVKNYLSQLPIHDAAKAYRVGLSIKAHAEPHANKKYLLKLDFQDFFPSICASDFVLHAQKYSDLSAPEVHALSRLLFRKEKGGGQNLVLAIGAPSSPFLSNTLLFEFDKCVSEYCMQREIRYSRYADDLAFSSNVPGALNDLYNHVQKCCRVVPYPRLILNEQKTVFTSKKFQRQLTGLILSNDGVVSLGREKKRNLRAAAHSFMQGRLNVEQIATLKGQISYSISIEPQFIESLRRMLGDQVYCDLMK